MNAQSHAPTMRAMTAARSRSLLRRGARQTALAAYIRPFAAAAAEAARRCLSEIVVGAHRLYTVMHAHAHAR